MKELFEGMDEKQMRTGRIALFVVGLMFITLNAVWFVVSLNRELYAFSILPLIAFGFFSWEQAKMIRWFFANKKL